jgi:hypothetical protein
MTAGHGKFQEPNSNNVPRYKSSEAIKEKIWTNDRCMIA